MSGATRGPGRATCQAVGGEALSGHVGRDPVGLGRREYLAQGSADAKERVVQPLSRPTLHLEGDNVEDAAGIDHEVWGIEDARPSQPLAVLGRRELVVGGAGDDPTSE